MAKGTPILEKGYKGMFGSLTEEKTIGICGEMTTTLFHAVQLEVFIFDCGVFFATMSSFIQTIRE